VPGAPIGARFVLSNLEATTGFEPVNAVLQSPPERAPLFG
jgi:hypothetical protein